MSDDSIRLLKDGDSIVFSLFEPDAQSPPQTERAPSRRIKADVTQAATRNTKLALSVL